MQWAVSLRRLSLLRDGSRRHQAPSRHASPGTDQRHSTLASHAAPPARSVGPANRWEDAGPGACQRGDTAVTLLGIARKASVSTGPRRQRERGWVHRCIARAPPPLSCPCPTVPADCLVRLHMCPPHSAPDTDVAGRGDGSLCAEGHHPWNDRTEGANRVVLRARDSYRSAVIALLAHGMFDRAGAGKPSVASVALCVRILNLAAAAQELKQNKATPRASQTADECDSISGCHTIFRAVISKISGLGPANMTLYLHRKKGQT